MRTLDGQRALVTGGSAGIGLALARQLAAHGARVAICGRDADRLARAQAESPTLHTVVADLGRVEDTRRLAQDVTQAFGGLSILVNNAGIQYQHRFPGGNPDEALQRIEYELAVNVRGLMQLTALLLPCLQDAPEAMIVNVSSSLAIVPKASAPVYCASKAAVHSFSRALRYQLEDAGTRVGVLDVMPSLVDTGMTSGRWKGELDADQVAREVVAAILEGREILRLGRAPLLYWLHRVFPALAARRVRNA